MAYTTPEKIQHELRSENVFSSSTIPSLSTVTSWIDEVDSLIDGRLGFSYNTSSHTQYFDSEGQELLFLEKVPVASVDSISEDTTVDGESKVWVSKSEDVDYVVYPDEGFIKPVISNWRIKKGRSRNIKVEYTTGDTVPSDISMLSTKLVTDRVISSLLSQNINERNDGGSISVGSISIVEPESYGANTYKQLKQDIDSLWDSVIGSFKVHRYG